MRTIPTRCGNLGRLFALYALLLLPLGVSGQNKENDNDKDIVKAALLADVSTVAPGQTFTVGVRFSIKHDWHIYWKNAGDMGLPTVIKFKAPDGFTVGELRWPTPMEFVQPGNIAAYGYHDDVLLTAKITAPKDLPKNSPITIAADVEWLMCEKVCIPGKGEYTLQLSAGDAPKPANDTLFKEWDERVPVAINTAVVSARIDGALHSTEPSPFTIVLNWKEAPQSVEWFPDAEPALFLDQLQVRTKGTETRVTFSARRLKGQNLSGAALSSVVAYRDNKGNRRGVELTVPLNPETIGPASAAPASAAPASATPSTRPASDR